MSDFLLLAAALVGSLFIVSHPLAFVKRFFKTFLRFFDLFFFEVRFCDRRLFRDDFVIISHPVSFVKRFFKLFLKFFQTRLPEPSVTPSR